MTQPAPLAAVVEAFHRWYDPAWARDWDSVGLTLGDPQASVRRVLFAVDPVQVVADEAVAGGFDLLITHHPLFLRGVHGVAATTPKGRVAHTLLTHGVALLTAHTNADAAHPGVSDALAAALGLIGVRPLVPDPAEPLDKIVTFVPVADTGRVVDALAAAGAGRIGAYSRCTWTATGTGSFRPEPGAHPAIGAVGRIETVTEDRVEMVLPRAQRAEVVTALRAAHPYEEPAFDVFELASWPGSRGLGRVGELAQPEPLSVFAHRVAAALPPTPAGIRIGGDPDLPVHRVAVLAGAGDSEFAAARASGAQVYVTADLRHHPASEALEYGAPALIDAGHWATEWLWLPQAAARVAEALAAEPGGGTTVETRVSTIVTDPWTLHLPTEGSR